MESLKWLHLPKYNQFSVSQSGFVVPIASVFSQYGRFCAVGSVNANKEYQIWIRSDVVNKRKV